MQHQQHQQQPASTCAARARVYCSSSCRLHSGLIPYPLCSPTHCRLRSGYTRKKSINWTLSSSVCKKVRLKSDPQKRSSNVVLGRMQLTLHATHPTPHGASRLVQAMSAWSVKTRRAPSRHCRDARVYGHTTTAMHDMSTLPPTPSPAARIVSFRRRRKIAIRHCAAVCAGLLFLSYPPRWHGIALHCVVYLLASLHYDEAPLASVVLRPQRESSCLSRMKRRHGHRGVLDVDGSM